MEEAPMTLHRIGLLITFVLVILVVPLATAQQPAKVPRIGYLVSRSGPGPNDQGFQQGLRELGYVEGQNIVIERRWAGGNPNRLPDLAADLVRLKVDVIFAGGAIAGAVQRATGTIRSEE